MKVGSFGLGFGAEKNDESDLASFAAGAVTFFVTVFGGTRGTAAFLTGTAEGLLTGASSFRFFVFGSKPTENRALINIQRFKLT